MLKALVPFVHRPAEEGFDSICTACASTVGNGSESELELQEKDHTCNVSNLERFTGKRSSLVQFVIVAVILFFVTFAASAIFIEIYQIEHEPEMATQMRFLFRP